MSLEDRLYPLLHLYNSLPQWTQSVTGSAYGCLPERWRLGKRYREFLSLAEIGESWSPEEIRQYQLEQLQRVLSHAAKCCPFYQRSFARAAFRPERVCDIGKLADCPTLEKRDLLEHRDEIASTAVSPGKRLYVTTGGSSGVPVGFYLEKGVSRPKEQAFLERMWQRAGYRRGMRLAVIRGHTTTARTSGRIAIFDATRNWMIFSSSHLTASRLTEYLDALERFRPEMIHAYPSSALQLAEYLERAGQSWRVPLRSLLCASERLTLPQKALLERVFNCRVYRWYGHSERVVLAGEGDKSNLFYFFPQYGLVEFGAPDADGLCEVIGTSFHNFAMPLIRYRTGDYVRVADPEMNGPLEFPWPAVADVAGRDHEFLVSGTNRRISLTTFNMHDAIFDGLYAVQLFQERPGAAEFRFVSGPRFDRSRLPKIEAAIRRKLGDDFQLVLREVSEVERTARGKHRWLVSRIQTGTKR
jgi:phenylacetate-CoA ligase